MRLPGTLLFYAGGLLIAPYLILPSILHLLILVALIAWSLCRSQRLSTICLMVLFLSVGLFQYKISISPPQEPASIHHLNNHGPVTLEGTVDSINARFPQGATCTVSVSAAISGNLKTVRSGSLRLTIDQLEESLSAGDQIRFRTKLRSPRLFGTPGEFNYSRHLAHKRIFVTGFVQSSRDIVKFKRRTGLSPAITLKRWSRHVGEIIDTTVPTGLAPYVRGLAIGDRGALSPDQREHLAHSGLSHLFAISGLHLGIIASFLYILFLSGYRRLTGLLRFLPPRRILPFMILPVVAAYMIFTGEATSTLRALLGLSAVTAAFLLRRQVAPLQLLAAAAFIMLLLDPLVIFTPAFQLSFAGAAGILCITPGWSAFCQDRTKIFTYPATLFVVTLAATVSTLPLVLLHFHILAPAGIVLNMIAVPAVTLLAVPLCLAGVVISAFSTVTAALFFNLAGTVIETLLDISSTILSLPGFSAHYLYLPTTALVSVGLLALVLIIPTTLRIKITGLTIALLLLTGTLFDNRSDDKLSLVAISVGQGDAALVTTSGGKTFLIDGGGFVRSNFDTGERLIAPTLGYLGISQIDTVVLTHNHPDHLNGLIHILEHFPVRNFWSGADPQTLPEPVKFVLARRHIPIRTFSENWSMVEQGTNVKVAVYKPPGRPDSRNDRSLVLYFQNGEDGLLMTGDLEAGGIKMLALEPPPGPVTLLKIPHHGSRYSNPQPIMDLYSPQTAYISVGHNNRYKQPHNEVLTLLKTRSIQLERTDLSGSLKFQSDGNSWKIHRWDKGLFR